MALRLSPHLTVMANAAQKAAEAPAARLQRGRAAAGLREGTVGLRLAGRPARRTDPEGGAEQGAPRLRVPDGGVRRVRARTTGPGAGWSIRSTAPPTSCTACRTGRSASGWSGGCRTAARELAAGLIYAPAVGRDVLGREGRRRLRQRAPPARLGAARAEGRGVRHRHPVRRGRRRRGGWRSPARWAR